MRRIRFALLAVLVAGGPSLAQGPAQVPSFPAKPIPLIVPFPRGGIAW